MTPSLLLWRTLIFARFFGPPNSQSVAVKEFFLFRLCGIRGPDVWRNLCEISCTHFPWKLKDENPRKKSPKFRCIFHQSLKLADQKFHPYCALGGYSHKVFRGVVGAGLRYALANGILESRTSILAITSLNNLKI